MNYINESIIAEISKLNFLGTFIKDNYSKNNIKSRSLLQFDRLGDFQIKVFRNVPKILENIFIENLYHVPVIFAKHNNQKLIEELSDKNNLENKVVLFKLIISNNKIQVKLLKIFVDIISDDYIVLPIARKKRAVNVDISNLQTTDLNFSAYPSVFGSPNFFYYKSNIYIHKFSITKKIITSENYNPIYQDSNIVIVNLEKEDIKQTELFISTEITNRNSSVSIDESITELEFINILINNAKKIDLFISERDIINFHTSLKTSVFTILDGQSGVGKSELIRLYANTIGLDLSTNFLEIPVSQNVKSFRELISNYDVGSFIERAYNDESNLYFLILDDFNSANIEVYLSEFLYSISKENSIKNDLYSQKVKNQNAFNINDNLIVIGTVSNEMSTYPITPKLVDRANYVFIEKALFKNLTDKSEISSFIITNTSYKKIKKEWLVEEGYLKYFTNDELKIFDSINDLLIDYASNANINFRTLVKMAKYSNNLPITQRNEKVFSRSESIDLLLYQNLIPKIYGSHPALNMIVGEYNGAKWAKGELIQLLESDYAKNISSFHLTIQALNKKAKELEYEGYAR
ncbi:MAG: ATPase associated with various cellular 5 [Bacillales bacterium]|nr:ATPase associated with various cellular 5 [Bacillales bacterium]